VCTARGNYDAGAVLEWTIAFIFSFYVFSFVVDLYPASYNRSSGGFKTTSPSALPSHYTPPASATKQEEEARTGSAGAERGFTTIPLTEGASTRAVPNNF
jgi:hypothetical protein